VISELHHYALEVPDLAVAEGFLQDFGLETSEKDGSLVARCPGRDQDQVRLVQAPAKRLHHVTFTLRPGSMDAVREALDRAGTPVIEPLAGATEEGLWIRDPDGTAVQLLPTEPAPSRPVAEVLVNIGATRIEDEASWVPRTFDPDEPGSIDMWLGPTTRPITQPQLQR
jgi:catechol 2,3-dioxygenase-like lactoylglutathione lyase family enzyme